MTMKTVILRDGETWCEVRPEEGGDEALVRGRIVRGNGGFPGDLVAKPAELTWMESAATVAPQQTVFSPLSLSFCADTPELEEGTLLDEIPDTRGDWNDALRHTLVDVELARALDHALSLPANSRTGKSRRRRNSDQAA